MSIVFDQHLGKKSFIVLKGCGDVDLFFKVLCIMAFFWPREPASELSLLYIECIDKFILIIKL